MAFELNCSKVMDAVFNESADLLANYCKQALPDYWN